MLPCSKDSRDPSVSLPCSQERATGLCREPDEFISHDLIRIVAHRPTLYLEFITADCAKSGNSETRPDLQTLDNQIEQLSMSSLAVRSPCTVEFDELV